MVVTSWVSSNSKPGVMSDTFRKNITFRKMAQRKGSLSISLQTKVSELYGIIYSLQLFITHMQHVKWCLTMFRWLRAHLDFPFDSMHNHIVQIQKHAHISIRIYLYVFSHIWFALGFRKMFVIYFILFFSLFATTIYISQQPKTVTYT